MKTDQTALKVRVGAFVIGGLVLLFALLFLFGRTQGLFLPRVGLATSFRNTAGLAVGAAVRLGGVDVGTVQAIEFSAQPEVKDVRVQLHIDARYLDRVRADSVARLAPKGLLGDMTIDISVGSAEARPLEEGATVLAQESQGLAEVAATVHEGVAAVADLSRGLRQHVDTLLTPQVERDWARMVHAAANVASALESGKGVAHAVLYDENLARHASAAARDTSQAAAGLARAMAGIDRLVAAVERGNGNLHELVFENDLGPLLKDARTATHDLADAAAQIRAGQGPLHALVYGREGDELLKNLTDLSRVLRGLGDDLAQGKGTMGAFLQDPTIYEDLKIILRDIKRNQLLKALVRFTIKQDGLGTGPATGGSAVR
jgi:phospholipid/cholesterol/gamma-HCH transport system substrate-binding protein